MSSATAYIAQMDSGRFAKEQAARRLARIVFEVQKTLRTRPESSAGAEAVHHLRVSTRRFRAVLDTFEELFPSKERKEIRKEVRGVFKLAGEVRNLDIAIEIVKEAGIPSRPAIADALRVQRQEAFLHLLEALRAWVRQDFSFRWRESLNLP